MKLKIKNREILGYVFQKNGKEISPKELRDIEDWLKKDSLKNKKLSNIEAIKFIWDSMN